jgi:ATP-binding cassette subfamily D (ALD) long-chain fatty acid import protein
MSSQCYLRLVSIAGASECDRPDSRCSLTTNDNSSYREPVCIASSQSIMAIQSRLRPALDQFKENAMNYGIRFAMKYRQNHAVIQRFLQFGYLCFILAGTYRGLNPKKKKSIEGKRDRKTGKSIKSGADSAPEQQIKKGQVDLIEEEASGGRGRGRKGKKGRAPKVEVDAVFFERLRSILRIVIPGARSKEALLLLMHTAFLILRTMISLYVAELDGRIVSAFVRSRTKDFLRGIAIWMIIAV